MLVVNMDIVNTSRRALKLSQDKERELDVQQKQLSKGRKGTKQRDRARRSTQTADA